ncbi:quinone oxidoreductase family protein [Pseudomaricurvus alkylphenolicus]|uniref:quinone oxidoreductase family protein n=1 Tax=Pseudomaricurvus alkylphenolicus TaxID=1306991 RepID=UPI00197F3BA9|nr:quinone oxidoreductase [Pseudomaricurvus alkylphenolicus]
MMSVQGFTLNEHGTSQVLCWGDVTVPAPGPGEVRVQHRAVGVNFIDIYFRQGLYPMDLPGRLGLEAAGVVEAVGEGVTEVKIGQRVSYCMSPLGAYAEAHVVPARCLVPLPDAVSFEQAAAITLKGLTAAFLLQSLRPMQKGEDILVFAAAGGVGQILCQWGNHLGLRVIGVTSSELKQQQALAAGCTDVVLAKDDIAQQVRQLTQGKGVEVVYDSVGADTFEQSLDCVARRGWLVSYGNASGPAPAIAPLTLLQKGSIVLTRPSLADFVADRDELLELSRTLFTAVEQGVVKVQIGQTYPLREAAAAQDALQARKTTGSTVLTLEE